MAAASFTIYNIFKKLMGENGGQLASASFHAALHSAGYTPNVADLSSTALGSRLTNTGYAQGLLATVEWSATGTAYKFDADDITFSASTIMHGKILTIHMDNGAAATASWIPVCYCDLADTGATSATGIEATQINVQFPATGIFTMD